jgi:hypothetical protein
VRNRFVLLLVVSCCLGRAAAQDGTCETFDLDSPECSAPCTGTPQIDNMIVGYESSGYFHIEYQVFTCASTPKGNSCNASSLVQVAQVNSWCYQGGGVGGGEPCGGDNDCSASERCYSGSCSACHEQGEFGKRWQITPKQNKYSIEKAVSKADYSLNW